MSASNPMAFPGRNYFSFLVSNPQPDAENAKRKTLNAKRKT